MIVGMISLEAITWGRLRVSADFTRFGCLSPLNRHHTGTEHPGSPLERTGRGGTRSPSEEEYLERKFGAAYVDHKSRVRRWL